MRMLRIDRFEFAQAFLYQEVTIDAFLNIETGAVVFPELEMRANAEQLEEIEFDPQYLPIPREFPSEGYEDMQSFIDTLEDEHLQQVLRRAIHGRGALRRFKDELLSHGDVRSVWFAFQNAREEARMREWLEDHDIAVEWQGTGM